MKERGELHQYFVPECSFHQFRLPSTRDAEFDPETTDDSLCFFEGLCFVWASPAGHMDWSRSRIIGLNVRSDRAWKHVFVSSLQHRRWKLCIPPHFMEICHQFSEGTRCIKRFLQPILAQACLLTLLDRDFGMLPIDKYCPMPSWNPLHDRLLGRLRKPPNVAYLG